MGDEDQKKENTPEAEMQQPDTVDPSGEADLPPELTEMMTAPPEQPALPSDKLPTIVLITAGLSAFDGVIILIYAILWMTNLDMLLLVLEGRAGFSLLLGAAPMILGAYVLRQNEKSKLKIPGAMWARVGVIVGTLLISMTLAIPVLATMRSMLQPV